MFKTSQYLPLLHQLESHFDRVTRPSPISKSLSPKDLRQTFPLDLPTAGQPLQQVHEDIEQYLRYAVQTAHPAYFNQLWGGLTPTSVMGDLLTSVMNTSMYTYEVAPVATLIEKTVIEKLGQLVGFSQPDGQFTTGGSNGNFMAMAIARHRCDPSLKQQGFSGGSKLIAFVSEEAHYSFTKAASLLGIGSAQLWTVPVDEQGKMQTQALEDLIQTARQQGDTPFFVAGTAGTTVRGAYDPLGEIAAIAQRESLWFHVDGAWGASVMLSSQHRHLMQGVEQADSVVWDAHKMMGMSLVCSVLLLREAGHMAPTFSADGTDYLFHQQGEDPVDLGHASMHCGRRVDAVKLWLTWRHLGDRGWEHLINRYFELAAYAETIINTHDSLHLITPRESLNLCFQYRPIHADLNANTFTLKIRQALVEEGIAMVNYAQILGETAFRLVICNNQTRREDLDAFFENLVAIAQRLEQEVCHDDA